MNNSLQLIATLTAVALTACGAPIDDDVAEAGDAIIGGKNDAADKGVVFIGKDGQAFCTGTLIDATTVLTAAHCYGGPGAYVVGVASNIQQTTQIVAVTGTFVHPNFAILADGTTVHDLLVLTLASAPVGVKPIAINTTPLDARYVNKKMSLVGFGANVTDGSGSGFGIKRKVAVRLASFDGNHLYEADAKHGSCNGDSGGPAFLKVAGKLRVVGVTSYGAVNCSGGTAYTRVDTDLAFLNNYRANAAQVDAPALPPGVFDAE